MRVTAEIMDMQCVSIYGATEPILLEDVEVCAQGRCIAHVYVAVQSVDGMAEQQQAMREHGYDDVEWLPTIF